MKSNKLLILLLVVIVLVCGIAYLRNKENLKLFEAPKSSSTEVQFRVNKDATLSGVINNLQYYGFIKDAGAFESALKNTKDTTLEDQNSIKVGNNTIATQSVYTVSQSMNAWVLAGALLNKGTFEDCNHGCPPGLFYPELLPGGELKSSEFEWVKNYEDCVKAKGTLTSEQYKGPKKCVIEGKEFTQGKEGFQMFQGG